MVQYDMVFNNFHKKRAKIYSFLLCFCLNNDAGAF